MYINWTSTKKEKKNAESKNRSVYTLIHVNNVNSFNRMYFWIQMRITQRRNCLRPPHTSMFDTWKFFFFRHKNFSEKFKLSHMFPGKQTLHKAQSGQSFRFVDYYLSNYGWYIFVSWRATMYRVDFEFWIVKLRKQHELYNNRISAANSFHRTTKH